MAIEEKDIWIADLNLFSGSSDRFRTTVGGYFSIGSASYGEYLQFEEYGTIDPTYLYKLKRNKSLSVEISTETIVSTQKYPIRVYSENDAIPGNEFWEAYWYGGTYGGESYDGIYSEDVFDDYWFADSLPYSKFEVASLVGGGSVENEIEVSYDYNFYLADYQSYAAGTSELLLPNMYLIDMFNRSYLLVDDDVTNLDGFLTEDDKDDTVTRTYDDTIWDFVTLDGSDVKFLNTDERRLISYGLSSDIPTLTDLTYEVTGRGTGLIHAKDDGETLYTLNLHEYLTGALPLAALSSSTTSYVQNALQNIMFDQNSISSEGNLINTFVDMEENAPAYPYYIKINFSAHGRETATDDNFSVSKGDHVYFAEAIQKNNYSTKFLKSLKEAFNGEVDGINTRTEEYVLYQQEYTSTEESDTDTYSIKAENTSFRTVDYFDLLMYSYKNYLSLTDNCFFVGEKTTTREAAMDTVGTYRYTNSENALGTLRNTLYYLTDDGSTSADGVGASDAKAALLFTEDISFKKLFNGWRAGGGSSSKYKETVAYRIEKVGGEPTGDSKTQNVLQNFWVFNSLDLIEDINLFDSQVKYGENYTYNIYKYVAVVGVKYSLSDLVLGRLTADLEDESGTPYCIEFYDPSTGNVTNSLYDSDEGNSTLSEYKNIADFNVTIEPTVKIFEIPMFSKTLKVLDHPPNQLNLNPFFLLDASQTLGYKVNYETFVGQTYPTPISSADQTLKTDYLSANDMLASDDQTLESRGQQRYVQVYRLSEMPSSYTDFDGQLISTIDLKLSDSVYTLPSTIFYNKVNTNQKYYYLFRVLNENMSPGQISEIYEAELINDGGYTYGMFDLLFAEDLEIDNFTNPTETFKKLIQLQPNMSQLALDDTDVDYEGYAEDEIVNMKVSVADDPIWDKTFKIRLTSKKTGRKIDLNVTYKYDINSN
jgi:hypothetical protein